MKNQVTSTFSISLLAIAISGCSSWPEHGQGGDAQMDTSHGYYITQADSDIGHHEGKGHLETQWGIHSLKLDTLVLRGGLECIPARVHEVSMMARRSRRELDGNLIEDARNSLVILQRELDELERRLVYIKRHTECGSATAQINSAATLTAQQKYQNRKLFLLNLLNDEYSFDVDSDEITAHYHEKLVIAAKYLSQDDSIRLRISGHTDSAGDYKYNQELALKRAKKVKGVLVVSGINADCLDVRSFGEQLPIDTNTNTLGRMKNRRVTVEFIETQEFQILGSDGLYFEQNSEFFGFKNQESNKVKYLKHWNKKIDNSSEGYSHEH